MINNVLVPNISTVKPSEVTSVKNQTPDVKGTNSKSFEDCLKGVEQNTDNQIKFSAHAVQRLNSRNIVLGDNDLQRLSVAVDKAISKGGRNTLVLMDGQGFIVDSKARTVVTAMDSTSMKEQVFTNIDTAVLG